MVDRLVRRTGSYDLKRISEAEENYLAYQVANSLYSASAGDVGVLSTTSTGSTSVGTFTDTFYNEPVGTHPATSITSSSTTTTLYQNFGTMTETNVYPVLSTGGVNFKATTSAQLDTICNRLLRKVFGSSYSSYYLSSSAPTGYTLHQASVFSDTRTDGTSVVYNLYKKNLPTKPTTQRPLKFQNNKNDFDFEVMTDVEIRGVFAARARNLIAANGIGSYLLRSATQGAPTATGTWVARGSATDTKQITSEVAYAANYTRDSTANFTRDSTSNFTRTSTRVSNTDFSGVYTTNYTRISENPFINDYTIDSTRISESNFLGNYTGTYTGNYTADYTGTYTGGNNTSYVRYYAGRAEYFVGDPAVYTSDSTRISTTIAYYYGIATTLYYTGNYVGNFAGQGFYDGANFTTNYTRISETGYSLDYTGTFTGNYTGNYIGTFTGNYTADYGGTYTGIDYTGDYLGDYIGNFIGDYTGNFIGNYEGNYTATTISATSSNIEVYTLYVRIA